MTPEQVQALREKLASNRQPIDRNPWSQYAHPRGWNDALDFVERTISEILGEKANGQGT